MTWAMEIWDLTALQRFKRPIALKSRRPTIASFLKENGYRCGAIGKWHLGFEWPLKPGSPSPEEFPINRIGLKIYADFSKKLNHTPLDLGFDYFFGIPGSLDMDPYCFIENDHTVGIPSLPKSPRYNQQRAGLMVPGWKDEEVDIVHSKKAIQFIENHLKHHVDQPFFLYLATSSPHRPCDCQPGIVEGKSQAGDRGDMVMLFDWVVGQIDETIEKHGLKENTLFIITSDNGARLTCANGKDYGHKSCGKLRGQKADIWDGGHREPFIARWPDMITPNSENDDLICLVDFFATCASIIDKPLPKNGAEDSFDCSRALLEDGSNKGTRDTLIHHSGGGMFSIRKGAWKFIDGLGSGGFSRPRSKKPLPWQAKAQLYNMENDQQEQNNLWKSRRDLVHDLKKELYDAIKRGSTRPLGSKKEN